MGKNVTQKLIETHLVNGRMQPGEEIGLRIDQTLSQDATGTMVMLEFEAMQIPRVKTELSAQYVDHNLLQTDFKNADDHLFLLSACKKFGVWYSRPGNGVSHPVHMERFGIPGRTLLGSDSHTPAAGALGMLAMGAGGLEVAMAMAGEPVYLKMPKIMGVRLTGALPDWVSAKDVILEILRRHGVAGGFGKIIEYYGPGLNCLSAIDRHVIANMGTELGATTTVFPLDESVQKFLRVQGREEVWTSILPDTDAVYDETDEIDLSNLEPLIALPSSPGNVVPVSEVAGREIYQAYIGSSANPGLRDFAVPALMVDEKQVHERVSFDINPTSRQIFENLTNLGLLEKLIRSGARIHQAGCNGCIGMGQAPATGKISLRTVPRNFPGRSGTKEDQVYLCSPETAVASALTGIITDPRTLDIDYPHFSEPDVITAFNFPVAVWSWNAFIALVCGDMVIWKPSSKAAFTAIATMKIIWPVLKKNGLPDGILNLVIGDRTSVGEALIQDRRIPLISATGSVRMGRHVAVSVAERLGKTILELGGNNGIIVTPASDLAMTAKAIVFGAIGTAGQRCTTTRRVIVHEHIFEKFSAALCNAYRQVRIGSPLDDHTHMGPLIDNAAVEAMQRAIAQIKKEGGRIIYGGEVLSGGLFDAGTYVSPCIVGIEPDAPIVKEETFAPILYLMKYQALEEALHYHNDVPQGLSAAIFTNDLYEAETFLSSAGSDCGIANVNVGTSGAEIGGVFGGEKDTGGSRESGSDAWKAYMRRQTSTINWSHELPLAQGIEFAVK